VAQQKIGDAGIELLRQRSDSVEIVEDGAVAVGLGKIAVIRGLEGRTPQDWLNRDQAEVDKYRADERCMFTFTLNAYYSMFTGILRLYDPAVLAGVPKDLPLLFLAGDADPVGERTAGVRRAIQSLRDAGVGNIESKFYPGARHELLVETNKAEVFADIAGWLEKQLHL